MADAVTGQAWSLFARNGFAGEIGGTGSVFGTSGWQDISVLDRAGTVTFDPSFNRGGDVVRLVGNAADWDVRLSGVDAVFSDGDTVVLVPVGKTGLPIVFGDGARVLRHVDDIRGVTLGTQDLTDSFAPITAAAGLAPLPTGEDAAALARVFVKPGGVIAAGGKLAVFGANGAETIEITKGAVTLDPSFNSGRDTLVLGRAASLFSGSSAGADAVLSSVGLSVTVPVGLSGMAIAFADGTRMLGYDQSLGSVMFGAQTLNTRFSTLEASSIEAVGDLAEVVLYWNQVALDAITAGSTAPPVAARALAIQSIAVYDAIGSIGAGDPYWVSLRVDGSVDVNAAVTYAAYTTLRALLPVQAALLDARLAAILPALGSGQSQERGEDIGKAIAQTVLSLRTNDDSGLSATYVTDGGAGDWIATPPGFAAASLPHWGLVDTFALDSASQFRAPAIPALTSAEYAAAVNEVKALGSATSATRTADQSEIALFWRDGGGTYTPPGHWNQIAQIAAEMTGTGTADNARTFAMLNVALADAAITAWETKYAYGVWRPITAITRADTDDNALTVADPAWTPLFATPNHPSYVSGHSTFSAAGAAVLTGVFGEDFDFELTSQETPGVIRTFASFDAAAIEAGMSRIYGGIHFAFDNTAGQAMGTSIGEWVLAAFGDAAASNALVMG